MQRHVKHIITPLGLAVVLGVGVLVLVVALSAGFSPLSNNGETEEIVGWPPPAETVDLGRVVYQANCAVCHGQNGAGEPDWQVQNADGTYPAPPHDSSGHTWHHADFQLFDMVKRGSAAYEVPGFRGTMPAYATVLGDDEIWAVLAYIKSRWPATVRARQESINARMKRARGE